MDADVVKNPIQNHSDSPTMRFVNQRAQILRCSKIRVNVEVIRRCVLMVKITGKNGGQVQALHTQLGQVR